MTIESSFHNLQFLVETIEPLWKQYDCIDSVIDEYRKRMGQPQANINLHRYATTDAHQPILESRCDTHDSHESMELTVENCVGIFLNADIYRQSRLRTKALQFICNRFDAVPIGDFQQIDEKNFKEIFKNDQIRTPEAIIFERLVQWMDRNKTGAVTDILKLIRLNHISIEVSCQIYLSLK